MARKKSIDPVAGRNTEQHKTGDPFFDLPSEEYWAQTPNLALKPTRTKGTGFKPGYHVVGDSDNEAGRWAIPATAKGTSINVDEWDRPLYVITEDTPHVHHVGAIPIKDTDTAYKFEELNKLMIPLMELRLRIAELQTSGISRMPLGDLLLTIQDVYRNNK